MNQVELSAERARSQTLRWLESTVIGLNLCPFAKAVHAKGQIHLAVTLAANESGLLVDFSRELESLAAASITERETTLLVAPRFHADDFLAFNEFVSRCTRLIRKRGLEGVFQLASFHPLHTFADAAEEDITNYTNRSPYPTLHLLREASIDRAVQAFPQAEAIYEANMETMRRLGRDGWAALGLRP